MEFLHSKAFLVKFFLYCLPTNQHFTGMNHPRVMFQTPGREEDDEPPQHRLGKLTLKYNRKDLQRRLDIEEWIDGQLHLLFDCGVRLKTFFSFFLFCCTIITVATY